MPSRSSDVPMTPAGAKIDEELLAAIHRLGRLLASRRATSRLTQAAGVELGQQGVQILRAMHRHGEQSVAGLAEMAGMDISAVSRQVRAFEKAGLLRRATKAEDRRVALVSLSIEGARVAEGIRAVGLAHLSTTLADWEMSDREELTRLLGRLVSDFARTEVPPPPTPTG